MESDDNSRAMSPAIAAGIIRAQKAAQAVGKSSENTYDHYKYASAEAVITEARRALGEAGIGLFQGEHRVTEIPEWLVAGDRAVGMVTVHYTLVADDGSTWPLASETPAVVQKGRPHDKAVATALTYALSYALRGLLLLPRIEEGTDVDQRDDSGYDPQARHEPAPARRPSPAARKLDGPGKPPASPPRTLSRGSKVEAYAWPAEALEAVHSAMIDLAIDGKILQDYLVRGHGARAVGRISDTLQTIPATALPGILTWMKEEAEAARVFADPGAKPDDATQDEIPM